MSTDAMRGRIIERVAALGAEDLRVLDAITGELPAANLRASLEAVTRAAIEPGNAANNYRATDARTAALAELWSAWRAWMRLLLPHDAKTCTGCPACPPLGVDGHLRASRTPIPGLVKAGAR